MRGWRWAAFPACRLDRAGIAFLGGAAMIAFGPLTLEEAFRAIDCDTVALLLGMMIVVAHLKVSGAFNALGALSIEHAHPAARASDHGDAAGGRALGFPGQRRDLPRHGADGARGWTRALGLNPLPYLVAAATASNCGSVATIAGNPQNMVIGGLFRNIVSGLCGLARAGRGLRPRRGRRRRPAGLPQGIRGQGSSADRISSAAGSTSGRRSRRASSVLRWRSPSSPGSSRRRLRCSAGPFCWSRARSSRTGFTT